MEEGQGLGLDCFGGGEGGYLSLVPCLIPLPLYPLQDESGFQVTKPSDQKCVYI